MLFGRPPIRRIAAGRYSVNLGARERELLTNMADELTELLENPDNPGLHRSFPPAYHGMDNLELADEYRRLMTEELVTKHRDALATLVASAQATELSDEELNAWLRALNQLRLTIGTRIDITPETESSTDTHDGQLYDFLTIIQSMVIDALAGA